MRVLQTFSTRWTPYSLTFLSNGSRLVIGGGTFYGKGGIAIIDLTTGDPEVFSCSDLVPRRSERDWVPTVASLCLSDGDRYLAAATRSARFQPGPACLFELTGSRLALRQRFEYGHAAFGLTPTGVLLYDDVLLTRNISRDVSNVFRIWQLPRELKVSVLAARPYLTHRGVTLVDGTVVTGSRWEIEAAGRQKRQSGLVFAGRQESTLNVSSLPVDATRQITAIVGTPSADQFLTGGFDGELDQWVRAGTTWTRQRIWRTTGPKRVKHDTWITYRANSVIGICYLADGTHWISVDAGGEVRFWLGTTLIESWMLPIAGSPRCLAAHPADNTFAIGVKQGGFAAPNSAVVIVRTELTT
jgi:hypothetical protein